MNAGIAYILSNLAITAGYVFLAAVVVPRATLKLKRTRYGGIGFFLLCGLHHLEGVVHYLVNPEGTVQGMATSLHMLLIDVPQAFAVWAFVTGLYIELVRWGPWGIAQDQQ